MSWKLSYHSLSFSLKQVIVILINLNFNIRRVFNGRRRFSPTLLFYFISVYCRHISLQSVEFQSSSIYLNLHSFVENNKTCFLIDSIRFEFETMIIIYIVYWLISKWISPTIKDSHKRKSIETNLMTNSSKSLKVTTTTTTYINCCCPYYIIICL